MAVEGNGAGFYGSAAAVRFQHQHVVDSDSPPRMTSYWLNINISIMKQLSNLW